MLQVFCHCFTFFFVSLFHRFFPRHFFWRSSLCFLLFSIFFIGFHWDVFVQGLFLVRRSLQLKYFSKKRYGLDSCLGILFIISRKARSGSTGKSHKHHFLQNIAMFWHKKIIVHFQKCTANSRDTVSKMSTSE